MIVSLGKDWEYFPVSSDDSCFFEGLLIISRKIIPSLDARFVRQEGEEEVYECFIVVWSYSFPYSKSQRVTLSPRLPTPKNPALQTLRSMGNLPTPLTT